MMNSLPYIKLDNLVKSFGDQHVLRGLSLEINRGELVCLVGPSGVGKSVILKHIMGLMTPDDGVVTVDGVDISHVKESARMQARSQMGFMFQQGALFDSFTVAENVAFPLVEQGVPHHEIEPRVREALSSVELSGHEEKMPANLSGGMIKRVAVARAMITMPQCLLYDEPTAGLDPVVSDSVSYMMRRICVEKSITTVVVTHDMASVVHIADRIIFLDKGVLYWSGTPRELIATQDRVLQDFWQGSSGEDWGKLRGESCSLDSVQKMLVEAAVKCQDTPTAHDF